MKRTAGWLFLNALPWYSRWPVKWLVLAVTVLLVAFPSPSRLMTHLQHWRHPDQLIEPNHPGLEPWVVDLEAQLADQPLAGPQALKKVERYVYDHVPYAWDWNTWGCADYLPTVSEVLEKGKEDCDGRAVVAASLLRRLGYETRLVSDFRHVWVWTEQGETMSPGKVRAIEVTDGEVKVQPGALASALRATSFGLAVFPFGRELIVVLVMWWLLRWRGGGRAAGLVALLLMLDGLLIVRLAGRHHFDAQPLGETIGWLNIAAGILLLATWCRYRARRFERRQSA